MTWHQGGCHCREVRFEVRSDLNDILYCNCSICSMKGFLHLIVPATDFRLLTPMDALNCYSFNTGTAKHYFCSRCGISSFYVPRSHPDGFDVNARCLDGVEPQKLTIHTFDGKQWEDNIGTIEGYST